VRRIVLVLIGGMLLLIPSLACAQEEDEEKFEIGGYVQIQGGMFLPLMSRIDSRLDSTGTGYYENPKNLAFFKKKDKLDRTRPCDPVANPNTCFVESHGGKDWTMSMLRGQMQLRAEWKPIENVLVHAVVRAFGSMKLDADKYAQPAKFPTGVNKFDYARDSAWDMFYNGIELREFYLDIEATDWLSFRIGRQQVVWGDINSYRLLDVVNPEDTTWHFGPLESFEDTRIPLWMLKMMFEMKEIEHSLEIVWVPGIDRPRDMVNPPLTLVGAWGLPLSNTPSPYVIDEKEFMYPGRKVEDQRIGLRWKGNFSPESSYSIMYFYTHQYSPPVPMYYDLYRDPQTGYFDSNRMRKLYLGFPRQHIVGFSVDYSFDSPVGMVAKLEASIEPDRMFVRQSTTPKKHFDQSYGSGQERTVFEQPRKPVINYALQFMRPTMIRWLNPTQNILFVLQFQHAIVPTLTEEEKNDLIQIPGYNDFKVAKNSYTLVFVASTNYEHGAIAPRVTAAYIHPESGFISTQVDFRLGPTWRLRLQLTDFFGKDPYKALGFFRDRDELNVMLRAQF